MSGNKTGERCTASGASIQRAAAAECTGQRPPRPVRRRTAVGASAAGPSTISLAGGQATIWADKDTNCAGHDRRRRARMRALNAVIDKLDIRRPQVLVQAIIADVAVDKTDDLGINWALDGTRHQRRHRRLHLPGRRQLDHRSVQRHHQRASTALDRQSARPARTVRHRQARGHRHQLRADAARAAGRCAHQHHRHPLGGHARQPGSEDGGRRRRCRS